MANYATGEEVVGAFFSHECDKGKALAEDDEGPSRGPKRTRRRKHDRSSGWPSMTISSPLSSARSLEAPPEGAVFDKMLKEPCPYHKRGAHFMLEDCRMLKKYFDNLGMKKDDQRKDKSDDKGGSKDDEGFPANNDCYMI